MILDTNFYINFCLYPDEKLFGIIKDNKLLAPEYLKMEVINILRKLYFFQGIPRTKIDEYETIIFDLIAEFVPDRLLLDSAKRFSFDLNHPIYDCIFLALAKETNNTFCSFDQKLIQKAESIGIRTINLKN
jgi:predicted nucleic acid-binding protein